jgi:hypothetical protein
VRGGVVKNTRVIRAGLLRTALTVIALLQVGSMHLASAQTPPGMQEYYTESQDSIVRNIMRSFVRRSVGQAGKYGTDNALGRVLELPPLPGDQSFADSAKIDEAKKYFGSENRIPDLGKNNRSSVNMVLPPLKGFQQLSDSEALKDMFKGMVVAQVPVLFQTYMMVENGAATGYMGGLNAVSNIMSNTMQTQDYQLKLLELTDDTGKMKEAYIQKVKDSFKQNKEGGWPAALYAASGDSAKFQKDQGMKQFTEGEAYDLKWLPSDKQGGGDASKRLLSDLLFLKQEDPQANQAGSGTGGGSTSYSNQDLDKLKREFVRLIGDVEIELKAEGGQNGGPGGGGPGGAWLRTLNMNFIAPEAKEERRGVARENWSEVQVVWESVNKLLYDYCNFAKQNPNASRKTGKKYTAATYDQIGGQNPDGSDPWEYTSAPDIPLTMSLLDALFHLVKKSNKVKKLNCDEFQQFRDDIPTTKDGGSGGGGNDVNLNDCGKSKGCLRNRLILHMAFIIARSRTLHTYRTMYLLSKRFSTDPALSNLVDELFERTLSGMNIDQELRSNRDSWERFTMFLAKVVQGESGAGAFLKPAGTNNSRAGSAGDGGQGQ